MNDFQKMVLMDKDRAEHRKYCTCGHSVVFPDYSKVNKILCTYCGYYIYKNKQEEFKDRLLSSMLKNT